LKDFANSLILKFVQKINNKKGTILLFFEQSTIGLFETTKITTPGLIRNLIKLLDEYGLRKKLVYVKDKGSIFNVRTIVLKSIVVCECLGLEENFQGFYFDYAFFKTCQYVTLDIEILNMFLSLFN
jgi:hypothetical protein